MSARNTQIFYHQPIYYLTRLRVPFYCIECNISRNNQLLTDNVLPLCRHKDASNRKIEKKKVFYVSNADPQTFYAGNKK